MDFSSPAGLMMAYHRIFPLFYTYVSVDHLSSPILSAERGVFLVKADNKEAYRCSQFTLMISPMQGVQWGGITDSYRLT